MPAVEAPFPRFFETDRLTFDALPWAVDERELYDICSADPEIETVTKFLSWEPHGSLGETLGFLERTHREWVQFDGAHYLIRVPIATEETDRQREPPIGGITSLKIDWDRRTGYLGLWLRMQFWGNGYAQERAAAMLEIAFERLDLELVVARCRVDNERSRRSIEKYVADFGGHLDGTLRNWDHRPGHPCDVHRYSIARTEYLEATA